MLKNVAIPISRHSCFLNSIYVGNFKLKRVDLGNEWERKLTKVHISKHIFEVCRLAFGIYTFFETLIKDVYCIK